MAHLIYYYKICLSHRLPSPNLAAFSYLSEVVPDAIAIAIVAFAISVSMAKIFARKHDYEVDPNQVNAVVCTVSWHILFLIDLMLEKLPFHGTFCF